MASRLAVYFDPFENLGNSQVLYPVDYNLGRIDDHKPRG